MVGDDLIKQIRKTKSSIKQLVVPGMLFENMGITYFGPIPGHNIPALCRALREARKVEGPVLLHVMTEKGKGYEPAEKRPDTVYIVIEQNERFYGMLRRQFQGMPGVVLVHGDAGDVCRFLNEQGFGHADYIISGLPFTSLPEQASRRILAQTRKAIGEEGVFVTFQYTLLRKKFLERYFRIQRTVRVWCNLPPAYVLQMRLKCSRKGNPSARQPQGMDFPAAMML